MVCAKHKDVAKAKIKKYRAVRKAKGAPATAAKSAAKKSKKASPKVARARKLQGQYLGALKSLTGANRARVKAVAKKKGVAAAVKMVLSLKKPKA
jgi:hypothetical protein